MSGAAEIAAGLTKAQKEMLSLANPSGRLLQVPFQDEEPLADRGVIFPTYDNVFREFGYALTPLGLEVRKHLQENPDAR